MITPFKENPPLTEFMNKLRLLQSTLSQYGWRCGMSTLVERGIYKLGPLLMVGYSQGDFGCWDRKTPTKYWASPTDIEYFQPKIFSRFVNGFDWKTTSRPLIGGWWDKLRLPLEQRIIYQSFKERIEEGTEWDSTLFYKRKIGELDRHGTTWHGCSSVAELDARCEQMDDLIESIRTDGYRSAKDLGKPSTREITVNIGRHGELLQTIEGRHRIIIAKLQGIETIPVRVFAIHEYWYQSRDTSFEYLADVHPRLDSINRERITPA